MMTEEDMRLEIARLESAVHQAKSVPASSWRYPTSAPYHKPIRGHRGTASGYKNVSQRPLPDQSREVVIGGQTFEANSRTLTRKPSAPRTSPPLPSGLDSFIQAAIPTSSTSSATSTPGTGTSTSTSLLPLVSKQPSSGLIRTKPGSFASGKPLRPRSRSLAKRGRGGNMSLVLNGSTRPVREKRRVRSERKQCKYFTRTGICTRGNVCRFQHDPNKTAICPRFLSDQCPNTADRCPLSHYPTPERVPVCVHFQNFGQCRNGDKCLYPHVRLGSKVSGVCRDFAVLGYCEKGIECDKGHVRECPDFADTGRCPTKGCKLPHVIRAKRSGPPPSATTPKIPKKTDSSDLPPVASSEATDPGNVLSSGSFAHGDEFISLTFHESESDSEGGDDDEEDEDETEDDTSDSPDDNAMIS